MEPKMYFHHYDFVELQEKRNQNRFQYILLIFFEWKHKQGRS